MVDATQILGELLGGGSRGSGNLNSRSGAKALEDLLGVGSDNRRGGGVFGGGDQQTRGGGSISGERESPGGGVFGGGDRQQRQTSSGGGLGDLLGKALKELTKAGTGSTGMGGSGHIGNAGSNNPFDPPPGPQVMNNEHAEVYVRAMIQAGLSDGRLDDQEQQAILQKVGDVGQQEAAFIRKEMAKGCDVGAFIHSVPRGIEEEVYAVALMAINLDNRTEAQFLDALARGLRITHEQSNAIHDRLGTQRLYN